MDPKNTLFNLPTLLLDALFPQFQANAIDKEANAGRRWSWIVRPLTGPGAEAILEEKALIFARWLMLAGPVSLLSVKAGPPAGAMIFFVFYICAAWTLLGVARTSAIAKKNSQEADNDNDQNP